MSNASDIIRPIVGLATDQFIPLIGVQYIFSCLYLSLQIATLLFWIVLFIAIVRDRHYDDSNNLLIISLALADIVLVSTGFHSTITGVLYHGYSNGFIGMIHKSI